MNDKALGYAYWVSLAAFVAIAVAEWLELVL